MVIFLILVNVAALSGFITLTTQVLRYKSLAFDTAVIDFFRTMESDTITVLMRIVTISASGWVIGLISVSICGILLWKLKRRTKAAVLAAAMAIGGILVLVIKQSVGRPRPMLYPWLTSAEGLSYPSGHTLPAVILAGIMTIYAHQFFHARIRWAVSAPTIAWALCVGVSRIYLGVHYPSDVIASICLGIIIIAIAFASDRKIRTKRLIERQNSQSPS